MVNIGTILRAKRRQLIEELFPLEEKETEVSHLFGPALKCPGGKLRDEDGTIREFPDRWWQYNDGGRWEAGFYGHTNDCVVRAIAIASGISYKTIYEGINNLASAQRDVSTAWLGVTREIYQAYIESLGWSWNPIMEIGSGCKMHLNQEELPGGRLIVKVSKHLVAIIDGVIHDTYDSSRGGTRCVYGYFNQNS